MKNNSFYVEDPNQVYGCFRCGELMGDFTEAGETLTCSGCGEEGIVSMVNALDMINDMYLKGHLTFHGEEVFIDDYIEE